VVESAAAAAAVCHSFVYLAIAVVVCLVTGFSCDSSFRIAHHSLGALAIVRTRANARARACRTSIAFGVIESVATTAGIRFAGRDW
jgi:hypothetical protein